MSPLVANPVVHPVANPVTRLDHSAVMNDELASDVDPGSALPWLEGWLPEPLIELIALGGVVSWILALLSVIVVAIVLFKSVELLLARRGTRSAESALSAWSSGRHREALDKAAAPGRGIALVVHTAMRARVDGHPESLIREEVQRVAFAQMTTLRSQLRTLEVIGQIAPLLGLFGTVLGMIEAFRRMEEAGSRVDPSVLSGGIWQALLTTGVGLAVAIPTVLLHQWLERRSDAHAHRIEDMVTRVFTSDLYRRETGSTVRPVDRHAA